MSSSQSYKKIFNVQLRRKSRLDPWGLTLKGGWQRGEWLEVTSIEANSPAFAVGFDKIRPGDFIVEVEGQIALFMTLQEALAILNEDKNELKLVLERGQVAPLTSKVEPTAIPSTINLQEKNKVTIILDKDKGIFAKSSSNRDQFARGRY